MNASRRGFELGGLGSLALTVFVGLAACGVDGRSATVRADLELPAAREARIAVSPALDVSGLYDSTIADRIVLDEVSINLADVRLLGADPRIPTGGLEILGSSSVVSAYDSDEAGLELAFPEYLLDESDLAVYARIDPSSDLGGASVVIRGRLYAHAAFGGQSPLTSAPDPDGDPADGSHGSKVVSGKDWRMSIDPDGDPARGGSIDPDGDPALPTCCHLRRSLVARAEDQRSMEFELRGSDAADLVASLDTGNSLDVVIGVPAARWLTPETMASLEQALAATSAAKGSTSGGPSGRVVLEARRRDDESTAEQRLDQREGYFMSDDPSLGRFKVHHE